MRHILKNYQSIILLLLGILVGSLVGMFAPDFVVYLKPIGDIFLNLLFVAVIPLLFFAITASIGTIQDGGHLVKIVVVMAAVFVVTICIASVATITGLWLVPVTAVADAGATQSLLSAGAAGESWGDRIVRFLSVSEFQELLSRQNILAFVLFSVLLGIAVRKTGKTADAFIAFLSSGNEVMQQLLALIMKAGPIGLGAYFAYQVKTFGPELFGFYAKPMGFYYLFGMLYFILFFSLYAYVARGLPGIGTYWRHNITPSLTAISTCSSLATMPSNIIAAKRMGIPDAVANVVIPLGNTLYKNGSAISSILKIYVAFAILGWNFFELETLLLAVGITLLVSLVAGGIPNGGFIGELLMISIYNIPNEAVPAVLIIGALVDPLATILNATGDTVAAMLVARFAKVEPTLTEIPTRYDT
ncbi:dicarboxylate/amino acid:cation symporter [Sphingobacterium sp. lm-10]|uniref:dicarboxylate/amino acid:cation symporter n=1 Tax=Sphingobacterium sp. lm-10 TaxID=2944904 RepID=UPI00201FC35E|nr:dicarboxylate/amino acid:cation symporter [Sphingobacterium sp. lm-10]MCL7988898.1 dicarboxylate/amino acid:cation symporter [Sphingobacterium sp. lm-10]